MRSSLGKTNILSVRVSTLFIETETKLLHQNFSDLPSEQPKAIIERKQD